MKTNKHIIQRQVFELRGNSKQPGLGWEQSVADHYRDIIAPVIEACFNAHPDDGTHLIIDHLEIDLGVFTMEDFKKEAGDKLAVMLMEKLKEARKAGSVNPVTTAEKPVPVNRVLRAVEGDFEALCYYLREGRLPWWFTAGERFLEEDVLPGGAAVQALIHLLLEDSAAMTRAVNLLPDGLLLAILQHADRQEEAARKELETIVLPLGKMGLATYAKFREQFWKERIMTTVRNLSREAFIRLVKSAGTKTQQDKGIVLLKEVLAASAKPIASPSINVYEGYLADYIATTASGNHSEDIKADGHSITGKADKTTPGSTSEAEAVKIRQESTSPDATPGGDGKAADQAGGITATENESAVKQAVIPAAAALNIPGVHIPGMTAQDRPAKKLMIDDEVLFVESAGLVILHPFLNELFSGAGLWTGNGWSDDAAQARAAQLLAYLSFGNDSEPEYRLVFHKVLAGLAPAHALPAMEPLTETEKASCKELLQAVVLHWKALRSTSSDGLREGFLQRNGKLEQTANGCKLEMEKLAQDILLSHLPWGYGTVKLPWMDVLMQVNWI